MVAEALFDVVFQYRPLAQGRDEQSATITRLATLLKADEDAVAALFDGQPWLIRSRVPLATAEKFQRAFAQAGAPCVVVPEARHPSSQATAPQTFTRSPDMHYSPRAFVPMLYARPVRSTLHEGGQAVSCYIAPRSPVVGLIVPFVLAVLIAFAVQYQFTSALSAHYPTSSPTGMISVVSVLLFFALIYVLFSLFTAKNAIDFYRADTGDERFLSLEKTHRSFRPTLHYRLLDDEGRCCGQLKHQWMTAKCVLLDEHGTPLARVAPYVAMDTITLDAAFQLRQGVVESWFLDAFDAWFRRDEARYRVFIVRDQHERIIAQYTYSDAVAALYLEPRMQESIREIGRDRLMAMLLLLGRH